LVNEKELIVGKNAGLVQIDLGIESGSLKSLNTLSKGIDVDGIKRAVQIAKKYVKVSGFFMIGIPGETLADIEMTFDLAKKLDLDKYTWSLFSPLPGSALYNDLKKQSAFCDMIQELEVIHFTENPYSFCDTINFLSLIFLGFDQMYTSINHTCWECKYHFVFSLAYAILASISKKVNSLTIKVFYVDFSQNKTGKRISQSYKI